MASRAQRIAAVARDIFGTLPNRNARSGAQILKKPLVAHYHERWYMEPIEPAARAVSSLHLLFGVSIVLGFYVDEPLMHDYHKFYNTQYM